MKIQFATMKESLWFFEAMEYYFQTMAEKTNSAILLCDYEENLEKEEEFRAWLDKFGHSPEDIYIPEDQMSNISTAILEYCATLSLNGKKNRFLRNSPQYQEKIMGLNNILSQLAKED